MSEWNGRWHPFAERFPMLDEQGLRDLADDIKESGQKVPCVMNSEGLGIDGRNRVAACRIAAVDPVWTVDDGRPMSIIISTNVKHRFLTTGQRAMAVAVDLIDKGLRENGRWKRGSVPPSPDDTSSSTSTGWAQAVHRSGVILDHLPDLADEVLFGSLALDAAYQRADSERKRRDGEAADLEERHKRIAALPADLAALVDNGVRDLADAEYETEARVVVAEVDKARDADGETLPGFGERVQDGALTWAEARKLAEEWASDRAGRIERDGERLVKATDGWSTLRFVVANAETPYCADLLDSLLPGRREAIQKIIQELKGVGA